MLLLVAAHHRYSVSYLGLLAGIAVEVATGAGLGHIVITSGSLVALVGGILFVKIFVKTKA